MSRPLIETLDSSGQKRTGHVYTPGGQPLARQEASYMVWKHSAPAGTGEYDIYLGGTYVNAHLVRTELDPVGADVSLISASEGDIGGQEGALGGNHFGGLLDARWSNIFDLSAGCTIDFLASSCNLANAVGNSEGGERCPDGPTGGCARYNQHLNSGRGGVENFHSYNDGYSGYLAADSRYLGEGLMTLGTIGQIGHAPDSNATVLAGTDDSSVTIFAGADYAYLGPQNTTPTNSIDFTKPECLPQQVKDAFKAAWKESGYGFKANSEYSFAIGRDPSTKALTPTTPQSTHEYSAGKIPGTPGRIAGVHTHGPGDLHGLSEQDKDSAIKGAVAMYVMSRDGGVTLFDPANKATQKSRRDINRADIDYAYGIRVGDVDGKNAVWNKPCK